MASTDKEDWYVVRWPYGPAGVPELVAEGLATRAAFDYCYQRMAADVTAEMLAGPKAPEYWLGAVTGIGRVWQLQPDELKTKSWWHYPPQHTYSRYIRGVWWRAKGGPRRGRGRRGGEGPGGAA